MSGNLIIKIMTTSYIISSLKHSHMRSKFEDLFKHKLWVKTCHKSLSQFSVLKYEMFGGLKLSTQTSYILG
jgi:intracellular sulfur oxidation DsrE/DsrF family protein